MTDCYHNETYETTFYIICENCGLVLKEKQRCVENNPGIKPNYVKERKITKKQVKVKKLPSYLFTKNKWEM